MKNDYNDLKPIIKVVKKALNLNYEDVVKNISEEKLMSFFTDDCISLTRRRGCFEREFESLIGDKSLDTNSVIHDGDLQTRILVKYIDWYKEKLREKFDFSAFGPYNPYEWIFSICESVRLKIDFWITQAKNRTAANNAGRAIYSWRKKRGFILIKDEKGIKSLTNDMETAINHISNCVDVRGYHIIYRDSRGIWDGVFLMNKNEPVFYPIGTTDLDVAMQMVESMRGVKGSFIETKNFN